MLFPILQFDLRLEISGQKSLILLYKVHFGFCYRVYPGEQPSARPWARSFLVRDLNCRVVVGCQCRLCPTRQMLLISILSAIYTFEMLSPPFQGIHLAFERFPSSPSAQGWPWNSPWGSAIRTILHHNPNTGFVTCALFWTVMLGADLAI
jgi:hypothetical protein